MRILMLTPYLPYPPSSGGQIRSFNLIKQLSKKHEITLCSLIKYDDEKKYVEKIRPFCKEVHVFKRPPKAWTISNILKTGLSSFPFLVIRNFSPSEQKALPKIIKEGNFDLIHAETFYVNPHIPKTDIPIVMVDQTIEYLVYEHFVKNFKFVPLRPMLSIDVLKLKYWERAYWKRAARVVGVSEKDVKVMTDLLGKEKVRFNPNGVGEDLMKKIGLHYSKTIVFMGNYAWMQNSEAARLLAEKVFPLIKKEIKDAKLLIAGQHTEKISDLKSDSVEIIDFTVDDLEGQEKIFKTSGVLVAPLYGPGGTRLKILAAMAAHLPVVTTNVGIAGIGKNGEDYLEGNTPEEIAKLSVKVLNDKKLYEKIAGNARKLVEEKYSYTAIAKQLDQIYEEVVRKDK
jgi:glycosyltransferase involved in cell wall biosynthesis